MHSASIRLCLINKAEQGVCSAHMHFSKACVGFTERGSSGFWTSDLISKSASVLFIVGDHFQHFSVLLVVEITGARLAQVKGIC